MLFRSIGVHLGIKIRLLHRIPCNSLILIHDAVFFAASSRCLLYTSWMQVGAKNADGLCYYDIVRGGMDKGVGLSLIHI